MYLQLGIRRGESLILRANAACSEFDRELGRHRHWLNVWETDEEDDQRYTKPSIKTPESRRQLPMPDELAHLVRNYRHNFRGRCDHSFLFTSDRKTPLAAQTVYQIFAAAHSRLSVASIRALRDSGFAAKIVGPHSLRHTAAAARLARYMKQDPNLDLALEKLRTHFGWKLDSEMPRHYAKLYFATTGQEEMDATFDTFVDALRSLEEARR
jgi:integrase